MSKQVDHDLVPLGQLLSGIVERQRDTAVAALHAVAGMFGEHRPCKLCMADILVFRSGDAFLVVDANTGTAHADHCAGYRANRVEPPEPFFVEYGSARAHALNLQGPIAPTIEQRLRARGLDCLGRPLQPEVKS